MEHRSNSSSAGPATLGDAGGAPEETPPVTPADETGEVFDWFRPAMRADPHPTLHRFRARSPIHRNDMGWWVLGYAEALQVLHDNHFWRDRQTFLRAFRRTLGDGLAYEYVIRRLTYYGSTDHRRLRGTVSRAFTPRRIESMRPYIETLAHELLDRVGDEREFDILEHLAHPLPSLVICQMLGVPQELRAQFDSWTQRLAHLIAPVITPEQRQQGTRALAAEWECVEELIAARRAHPGPDLLSALIEAEEDGQRLTHDELITTVIFLFSAGHQTTRDTLGVGLLGLLTYREQFELLVENPGLAPAATEECLRWSSVVALAPQQAQHDVALGDVTIAEGETAFVVLPAANRDPRRFAEPDRFWIERPDNQHLAFSGGPHFCLGASLGKLELSVLLGVIATRFPHLQLAGEHLEWRDSVYFRGPKALVVTP